MVVNQIKLVSIVTVLSFANFAIASEPLSGSVGDVAAKASAVMASVRDRRPDSPVPVLAAQRRPAVPKLPFGQLAAYAAEDGVENDFSGIRAAFALNKAAQARAGVEALARLEDSGDDSDCSNKAVRASDDELISSAAGAVRVQLRCLPRPSVARPADAPFLPRPSMSGASSASGSDSLEDDEAKAQV